MAEIEHEILTLRADWKSLPREEQIREFMRVYGVAHSQAEEMIAVEYGGDVREV